MRWFWLLAALWVLGYIVLTLIEPSSCPEDWNDSDLPPSCERWARFALPSFVGMLALVPLTAVLHLGTLIGRIRRRSR
jgi:hypothetical protein